MHDENFHKWKVIPLHLICLIFGQDFKFHSNLSYDTKLLTSFPVFYKNIFRYWSQNFTVSPELLSSILCTFYGMYKYKYTYKNLNQQPIYFKHFSNNNLNYVTQLFDDTGNTKELVKSKREFNLNNYFYFKWMQLIHSIPQKWQNNIKNKIKHGLKGTLMQIWKSANIFVFIWK